MNIKDMDSHRSRQSRSKHYKELWQKSEEWRENGNLQKHERDSHEWNGFSRQEKLLNFLIWYFYRAIVEVTEAEVILTEIS